MTLAVWRSTVRLALRSAWPWAITLVAAAFMWLLGASGSGAGALAYIAHQGVLPFSIFFLGQMLAVTYEGHRERSAQIQETLDALPCRAAPWVLGRLGGLYVVWLAMSGLLWLFGVLLLAVLRPATWTPFLLWDWLWLMPVSLAFSTGVAFAIGFHFRRGFAAFGVTLLLYLVGTSFMGLQIIAAMTRDLFHSGPPVLLDFGLGSFFPLSDGTAFPNLWPLIYNRVHGLAVAVFWAGALTWTVGARRKEPVRWARFITVAALSVAMLAFVCSRAVWTPRVAQYRAELDTYRNPPPAVNRAVPAPRVAAYDISLQMDPLMPGLSARAVIDLSEVGETAVFTLNRSFAIRAVQGPDGAPVAFDRSGDFLILSTGGRSGRYTVGYAGQVWQWRADELGGLRLAAHVARDSAMLPAAFGWYPLPGLQILAVPDRAASGVVDGPVFHAAIPFHVAVTGLPGLQVLTNAEGGRPVTAAWLLVTPYQERTVGGFTFYVSQKNKTAGESLARRYGSLMAFWAALLPGQGAVPLVEIPDSLWYSRITWAPAAGFSGDLVLSSAQIARMDSMLMAQFLSSGWWGEGRTAEERQVLEVLGAFMFRAYAKAHPGEPLNTVYVSFGVQYGPNAEPGQKLLADLDRYAGDNGLEATARLLQRFRGAETPLTWQQAAVLVKGDAQ